MFHGIRTLKNPETGEPILTHIEMDPDAKPVIRPPRPVPHHLEEKKIKKKLDYFVLSKSFLQMVGCMSRFIQNFAQIAAPLRQ